MNKNERREIILDNYEHPYHREKIDDDSYLEVNTNSQSCIDNLDLSIKIEHDIIQSIYFTGEACAISTSATSIMNKLLEGKNIDEAINIIENYENMIEEKNYDDQILKEANCFNNIYKHENRKGCALLSWQGIKKLLLSQLNK